MKKEIMTPENPRWIEFTNRLGGEEGCDFRDPKKGEPMFSTGVQIDGNNWLSEKPSPVPPENNEPKSVLV
jgi:hypothetical protein